MREINGAFTRILNATDRGWKEQMRYPDCRKNAGLSMAISNMVMLGN